MSTYSVGGEGREEVSVVTRVQMPEKGAEVQVSTSRSTTRLGGSCQARPWIVLSPVCEQAGHLPVKPVHGGKLAAGIC